MHEAVSIAALFVLLAVAGAQVGQAETAKTCRTGLIAAVLSPC
jgi:hypothetical protein